MMEAVRQGLSLCARSVVPALFPYMVMVNFLISSGLFRRVPCGVQAFLLGALGGYPMGAKAIASLCRSGQFSSQEATRLAPVCNNCSPAFCIFLVGQTVFHSTLAGIVLYAAQLLSALILWAVFRPKVLSHTLRPAAQRPSLSSVLVDSVQNAALNTLYLCGFVVLFQVVLFLLPLSQPFLIGLVELTNGVVLLDGAYRLSFVAAAFLVSFGGLCTAAQTAAVLGEVGVPCKGYLPKRLLVAALSAVLAGLACEWVI